MNKKRIIQYAYIALVASLLMLLGDMFLYFPSKPLVDLEAELLPSMYGHSHWRLFLGGIIGPIAILPYIFGFIAMWGAVKKEAQKSSYLAFLLLVLGNLIASSYHAFFPVFGLVEGQAMIDTFMPYVEVLGYSSFILMMLAWFIYAILIGLGKTILPRWSFVLLPCITVWLGVLWEVLTLPHPINIILVGGWNNIIHTIFFTALLLILKCVKTK